MGWDHMFDWNQHGRSRPAAGAGRGVINVVRFGG